MSAFIVDDKTINSVVSYLASGSAGLGRGLGGLIKDELGLDLADEKDQRALGEAMFRLNCQAVEARYGDGTASDFRDLDYCYSRVVTAHPAAVLKSLNCWQYQCSEGNIPDESLLFATMERVAGMLANQIVSDSPAYDQAAWG